MESTIINIKFAGFVLFCTLLLATNSDANQDQSFAGLGIGASELLELFDEDIIDPPKQNTGKTIKYFFGYNIFDNMPLSLGYLDMGTNKITTSTASATNPATSKISVKGLTLDIGYEYSITQKFSLTAGVGSYKWKAEILNQSPNFSGGVFVSYATDSTLLKDTNSSYHLRFKYMPDVASGWMLSLERIAVGGVDSNVATINFIEHY